MKELKEAAHKAHSAKTARMTGHSDEKEDRGLVKKMVKPAALTGKAKGGTAKKGKTQVNVLVGQPSAPAAPSAAPRAAMPAPAAGAMPATAGAPPGLRKCGGAAKKARGGKVHMTAGADSGIGRLEKNHKR